MDNIVTLIVIIIVVLSIFSKLKARRKTQPGATPLVGGWVTKLKALLTDIQRQIEQQSKDRTTGASGWDQFLDDGETFSTPSDADAEALDDRMFEQSQTQPPPKRMPPAAPVRSQTSRSDRIQLPPGAPRQKALHAGKPSRTFMAASRADLRKAVIWSEILGPPVALRDQRSGRR